MTYSEQALSSLGEILKRQEVGEVVNTHVLEHAEEPKPDFAQMQRTVFTFVTAPESPNRGQPRKAISEKS